MTRRSPLNLPVWILATVLALHTACSGQQPGDQKAVTAAINDIFNRYSSSLNSGDIDRWMSLWADNGVQMPPNEPPVIGKDAIRARNRGVLDRFVFNMTITNDEVGVGGDWAFARGTYAATLSPKAGGAAVSIDELVPQRGARAPAGARPAA